MTTPRIIHADSRDALRDIPDASIDACVTDPHAGFEVRDQLAWLFGSGFPKSHDVSKGIDRAAGAKREVIGPGNRHNSKRCAVAHGDTERLAGGVPDITAPATDAAKQWQGWGTALKPAHEPVVLARKPLIGTVASNVLAHGTGALNIDASRVDTDESLNGGAYAGHGGRQPITGDEREGAALGMFQPGKTVGKGFDQPRGRWPANVIHDGSEEVLAGFPDSDSARANGNPNNPIHGMNHKPTSYGLADGKETHDYRDTGSAARFFFYTAKADKDDRLQSKHPTVKPVDLIAYLVRLITPPGGTVLDPFAGSGTTGMACMREGFECVLIEREAEYVEDIKRRLAHVRGEDAPLFAAPAPQEEVRDLFGFAAQSDSLS